MIDIKILREDPAMVAANCARRGCDIDIDALVALDAEYRALIREVEDMRSERKRLSKLCKTDVSARDQVRQLKETMGEKETRMVSVKADIDGQLAFEF